MGCRIRENTWRQCDSKQKRIKLKWRTHAAHTNLQLVVARSSSKSQLKFLFDLANVSDSAGSRRHRWTRTDNHIGAHCLCGSELYIYMCVRVCVLCVCVSVSHWRRHREAADQHGRPQCWPNANSSSSSIKADRQETHDSWKLATGRMQTMTTLCVPRNVFAKLVNWLTRSKCFWGFWECEDRILGC